VSPSDQVGGHTLLSVVLITRNQASTIGRLIESVLRETAVIPSVKIVLVDSASEDETVELARNFSTIGILRLRRDQRLTAAAGRFTGFHRTTGTYILFVDGDMELCPGWLDQALTVVENDETIGAVTGLVVNTPSGECGSASDAAGGTSEASIAEISCRNAGGVALYRRAALDRCGTFTPGLYSDEEPELCLRLRREGYRFVRIERIAVLHFVDAKRTFASLLARRRRNLYLGYGQILRLLFGNRLLLSYLRWRGYGVAPIAYGMAGIGLLAWFLVAGSWIGIAIWSALLAVAVAIDAIRKRSLYGAGYSLLNRLCIVEGTIRGILLRDVEPRTYLDQVEIVQ
jgi:glycosyltransferase involved in cell wall biosynthesis